MTVTIPSELEKAVQEKAAQRQVSVEQLVREAIEWYLGMDAGLLDELKAWQGIRDEAAEIVAGTSS